MSAKLQTPTIFLTIKKSISGCTLNSKILCSYALCLATGLYIVEELVETVKARFIVIGFDFATILSSPSCSCILFVIVSVQLVKVKF